MDTKQVGRPTDYTKEAAVAFCDALCTSDESVALICKREGMPDRSTIYRWLNKQAEFRDLYMRARELQTEFGYDRMQAIADAPLTHNGRAEDDPDDPGKPITGPAAMAEVQRRKLLVDIEKFKLVKLQPKRFGDKSTVDVDVKVNHSVTAEQFQQLLQVAAAAPAIEDAEVLDEDDEVQQQVLLLEAPADEPEEWE